MEQKKSNHGGAGRGQGRKPMPPNTRRQRITVSLKPVLIEWLKSQEPTPSEIVESLIESHINKKWHVISDNEVLDVFDNLEDAKNYVDELMNEVYQQNDDYTYNTNDIKIV